MTLQEKLNFFKYATLADFKVGLRYEIVEREGMGVQFIQKEVTVANFMNDARDYHYQCERNKALVRDDSKVSPEWLRAQEDMNEKTKEFMADLKEQEKKQKQTV